MAEKRWPARFGWSAGAAAGLVVAGYAGTVVWGWIRYGLVPSRSTDTEDALLDRFMPDYEVVERHSIRVAAPASITLDVAKQMRIDDSAVARAIFRARERVLRANPAGNAPARTGLVAETLALGWRVLAEQPDHEIVLGAVTRPWDANVVFRGLAPEEFRTFCEPDYIKIAWTLRADASAGDESIFRTETRAIATSPNARRRFRWY